MEATPISKVVKSWALGRRCKFDNNIEQDPFEHDVEEACQSMDVTIVPNILQEFYKTSCDKVCISMSFK